MKYNGPFKVIQKLSPVSYQLQMPASYSIHPIINIAHLEKYQPSPTEFGNQPKIGRIHKQQHHVTFGENVDFRHTITHSQLI